jgi:ABC-type multidrug transport system ATPase subunit
MDIKVSFVSYLIEKNVPINNVNRETFDSSAGPTVKLDSNNEKVRSTRFTKTKKSKELLLSEVNIHLSPGTVTAFIGTGEGFRSLLECIALRQTMGFMSGSILYDGVIRKSGIFKDIAFISESESSHFDSLTVFEYLVYGARLRISHGMIECRERSRMAAKVTGLEGTTKLGNLNLGELRLLSIAVELVGNPTLICLSNPIQGLDSSSAILVIKTLHRIAKRTSMPTTIIFVADGLNYDLLRYVNNTCLFCHSKLLFTATLREYSKSIYESVVNLITDVSIHLFRENNNTLKLCTGDVDMNDNTPEINLISRKVAFDFFSIIQTYVAKDESRNVEGSQEDGWLSLDDKLSRTPSTMSGELGLGLDRTKTNDTNITFRRPGNELSGTSLRKRKSYFSEICILVQRASKYHYKNKIGIRMSFLRFLFAGLIVGILVYGDGESLDSIISVNPTNGVVNDVAYNVTSVLFFVVSLSVFGVSFAIPYMHANAQILRKEVLSGLHTTFSVWITLVLIEMPVFIISSMVVGGLIWLMVSFQGPATSYFFAIMISTLTGYSLASACAVWSRTASRATFIYAILGGLNLVFTGYIQQIPQLPPLWEWATNISFTRWSFESLMIGAFENELGGDNEDHSYLSLFSFANDSSTFSIFWSIFWLLLLQFIVIVGLIPPNNNFRVNDHVVMDIDSLDDEETYDPKLNPTYVNTEINKLSGIIVSNSYNFQSVNLKASMQVTIAFQRLKYIPDDRYGEHSEPLISGISGRVVPGNSCCIIDANEYGAGKMLLNILAGKYNSIGKTTGVITANGSNITKDISYSNFAFIPNGDLSSTLTVLETLKYAALLRRTDQHTCTKMNCLKKSNDYIELDSSELYGKTGDVDDRIQEVISMMGLSHIVNVIIQSHEGTTHISPAELRCLTIAAEIVNRPGLIFMDDPFKDLDWYSADIVATAIQTLTSGGRTIICLVAKPTKKIMESFTDTILLGSGLLLYFGPTLKAASHFDNIGFEVKSGQNSLEYLLEIASDRGVMKLMGGKRGSSLSLEDVADLCRSLTNINGIIDKQSTSDNKQLKYKSANNAITNRKIPPIGPILRVLISRGFSSSFSDRKKIFYFVIRYVTAGLLIGSLFWHLDDGNYLQRMSLFATIYFCLNVAIVDVFKDLHKRKETFIRENLSGASHFIPYWFADSGPIHIFNIFGSLLFCYPVYFLSELRSNEYNIGIFYALVFASIYCNLGMAYCVATFSSTDMISRMVFNGIVIPLQMIFSGYLILLPSMKEWYKWISYLSPMSYYLSGVLFNEFKLNPTALGNSSYADISNMYGFTLTAKEAIISLFAQGIIYRLIWLVSLRITEILKNRKVMRKIDVVRKKAKKFVTSSLRWNSEYKSTSLSIEEEALAELETASNLNIERNERKLLEKGYDSPIHIKATGNVWSRNGQSPGTKPLWGTKTNQYIQQDDSLLGVL